MFNELGDKSTFMTTLLYIEGKREGRKQRRRKWKERRKKGKRKKKSERKRQGKKNRIWFLKRPI